jgi:hypothetical protein
MKERTPLFKLAAVASSILLASGFIGYRAGAIHWLAAPTEKAVEDAVQAPHTIMYSSKDAMIVESGDLNSPATPASANPQSAVTIMPGSKSVIPLISPPTLNPAGSPPPPTSQPSPPSE